MKTITKLIIYSFLVAFAFAGCVKEEAILDEAQFELVARMEYEAGTKTSLSGLQDDGMYYPLWSEGDEIAVYVDGDTSPSKFTLKAGEGTTEASFSGTREGESYYAVYPFSAAGTQQDGTISFTLPQTQQYVAGSFGPDSYPMVATGTKNGLDFMNLCAVMKISITGEAAIRSITLTAKDTTAMLSGPATVSMVAGASPELVMGDGGSNSVVLECKGTELSKDAPVDFHFVIPSQTYKGGFEISIDAYTDVFKKNLDADLTFKRSQMRHLEGMELETHIGEHDEEMAKEREALIAIYDALDGDNWINNENWCSDKPLEEWYGLMVNEGRVFYISLTGNNLHGHLPASISNLSKLEQLYIDYNDITSLPEELWDLKDLSSLHISGNKGIKSISSGIKKLTKLSNFSCDQPLCDGFYELTSLRYLSLNNNPIDNRLFNNTELELLYLYDVIGEIPEKIGNLARLKRLQLRGDFLQSQIPGSIGKCCDLEFLSINCSNIAGSIPLELGNCLNLKEVDLSDNSITGSIPPTLGNCSELVYLNLSRNKISGAIPAALGNCSNLKFLYLEENSLESNIPDEIGNLPLQFMSIFNNHLYGPVPQSLMNNKVWKDCWGYICQLNDLDTIGVTIDAPMFNVVSLEGEKVNSDDVYKANKYTLLYNFYPPPHHEFNELDKVKLLYEKYKSKGLQIIGYCHPHCDYDSFIDYTRSNNLQWYNIYQFDGNEIVDYDKVQYEYYAYHYVNYPINDVGFVLVDSTGKIVLENTNSINTLGAVSMFIDQRLGDMDYYISTDYSQDGTAVQLQKASEGNGINIVLMGDGYSDRQIADGTYKADMEFAYGNLFTKEPYKSFKSLFNVSYVNVVSATEGFEHGNTALAGGFGDGTLVYGNDNTCFNYAQKVVSPEQMDQTLVVVVMNSNHYAGTCYMYYPNASGTDYGTGAAVAYFPKGEEEEVFAQLLHHEANGHGFAKLADEYAYEYMGTIPAEEAEQTRTQQEIYGWWKNVDFTNDPAQVRWKKFLDDSRYANQGLGVFEGGLTYWSGVWRPTENSIMRYNQGEFNAPSREAIYYRIHKLAYGNSWKYDYEKFVEWDAVNRKASSGTYREHVTPLKPSQRLHPPVVVGKHWSEAAN